MSWMNSPCGKPVTGWCSVTKIRQMCRDESKCLHTTSREYYVNIYPVLTRWEPLELLIIVSGRFTNCTCSRRTGDKLKPWESMAKKRRRAGLTWAGYTGSNHPGWMPPQVYLTTSGKAIAVPRVVNARGCCHCKWPTATLRRRSLAELNAPVSGKSYPFLRKNILRHIHKCSLRCPGQIHILQLNCVCPFKDPSKLSEISLSHLPTDIINILKSVLVIFIMNECNENTEHCMRNWRKFDRKSSIVENPIINFWKDSEKRISWMERTIWGRE